MRSPKMASEIASARTCAGEGPQSFFGMLQPAGASLVPHFGVQPPAALAWLPLSFWASAA